MSEPDKIKQAFSKVKTDIYLLQTQISDIKEEILKLTRTQNSSTDRQTNKTEQEENTTKDVSSTDTSTHIYPLEAPKTPNSYISSGNKGVSTDRQTNRQTDNKQEKFALNQNKTTKESEELSNLLSKLNSIKSNLSEKFQSLTQQEFLVFSAIYQSQSLNQKPTYSSLAEQLSLTESSIRDYVQRILKKGIPLDKTKENNKKVYLFIPKTLIKLAPLEAIISLRDQ
jgi:DNA-binding MarR family transcriptional regulator